MDDDPQKWDTLEIQEETDDNLFKSQIRLPAQPSLILQEVLISLNANLTSVLPHTIPRKIHGKFVEENVTIVFASYDILAKSDLNQTQALQFLFDVRFLTLLCVTRDNNRLMEASREICDNLRSKIDPFDLDVFYEHLQRNVKQSVLQLQVWTCYCFHLL